MLRNFLATVSYFFVYLSSAWSQVVAPPLSKFVIDGDVHPELAETIRYFPGGTELAIALIHENGQIDFYGCRRSNDSLKSIANQDRIFQMGSISKVFTATSLAQMVSNDELELTDKINEHFDFPFKNDEKITFQELATHSSGLPRMPSNIKMESFLDPYKDYNSELLETYLKEQMKVDEKEYAYSNLGAGLLGYTLAKVKGTDYNGMIQKLIAEPFELTSTTQFPDSSMQDRMVEGLGANGSPVPYWQMDALAGAGVLYTTVNDLSKFIFAQFDADQKALALTREQHLKIDDDISIGLGWHILHDKERNDWWWHNGGVGGFTSSMAFDPEKRTGVVVLSNVSAFHAGMGKIDKLCFRLLKEL